MYMGDLKSLSHFWENLAKNHRYQRYVQEHDILEFHKRVEHEGLHFLTIVLPKIGKALDNFHSTTLWECPSDFKSDDWISDPGTWNSRTKYLNLNIQDKKAIEPLERENGETPYLNDRDFLVRIPKFLGVAIKFALEGDSSAVDCVRQLSYVFYKLELDHDDSTVSLFLDSFVKTDQDLALINFSADSVSPLIDHMKRIIARILVNQDPHNIRPCHGSGATACKTANWDKYHTFRFIPKLDEEYPYSEHFFYNATHLADDMQNLINAEIVNRPKARVVLVPKDSRGPRIISCEPAEHMFIQQGIMKNLYEILEAHPLTSGQLNFTDQSINRHMAWKSSKDGSMATMDLSDASDRVSLELVSRVFPENWLRCFKACRSEVTVLPDGREVELNKFAPMGSACCFPVEALVFWACAQAKIYLMENKLYRPGFRKPGRVTSRESIYVYGDDIIVPSVYTEGVMEALESIGLLVNRNKTFSSGPFRESCGGDFHNGYDVTPVRVRHWFLRQGTGIHTCADLVNSLITKFGYTTVGSLISVIETELDYQFPRTDFPYPGTIRVNPSASNDVFFLKRFNKKLQREEHRIVLLVSKALAKHAPNWGELLRKELQRDQLVGTPSSYQHWSKPVDAALRPGWYTDTHSVRQKWGWAWLG